MAIKAKITSKGEVEVQFDMADGYKDAIEYLHNIESAMSGLTPLKSAPTPVGAEAQTATIQDVPCPKHPTRKMVSGAHTWTYEGKTFVCDGNKITTQ